MENMFADRSNSISWNTEKKYRSIYKSFLDYVEAEEGPEVLNLMLEKLLSIGDVALVLARYFSEGMNTTDYRHSRVAQKLDISTIEIYWYAICFCMNKEFGYHPGKQEEFDIARKAKNATKKLAKQS